MICGICQNLAEGGRQPRMFALQANPSMQFDGTAAPVTTVFVCAHKLSKEQLVSLLAPAALFVLDHFAQNRSYPSNSIDFVRNALVYRVGLDDQLEQRVKDLLAGN